MAPSPSSSSSSARRGTAFFQGREVIALDDIDDLPLIDLTLEEDDADLDGPDFMREDTPQATNLAGATLPPGQVYINNVSIYGATLRRNSDIELNNGKFMRVKYLVKDLTTDQVYMHGLMMSRVMDEDMKGQLRKWCNDVCMISKAKYPSGNPELWVVSVDEYMRDREIVITNTVFPAFSSYQDAEFRRQHRSLKARKDHGVLTCRWWWIMFSDEKNKIREESIRRFTEEESDPGKSQPDVTLLRQWREGDGSLSTKIAGKKRNRSQAADESDSDLELLETPPSTPSPRRGGRSIGNSITSSSSSNFSSSSKGKGKSIIVIDDEDDFEIIEKPSPSPSPSEVACFSSNSKIFGPIKSAVTATRNALGYGMKQSPEVEKYTYGDICAGAGGMARAAHRSGLHLKFLLDNWDDACATLRRNFPSRFTRILHKDIFNFCVAPQDLEQLQVDVLHISFPCQPHSPMHTVEGKNDEANIAAGYSVIELFKKCRPRIVTFEQTSGILTHRGRVHFHALVHQITHMGYSIRFKIMNCAEFGNVHARMRAFILAAAPGQVLPDFPKATHGEGLGMQPLVTIRNVLDRLRGMNVEHHMKDFSQRPGRRAYDPNGPLTQAITCSGGMGNVHPRGGRTFSLQELALLGGFPKEHKFANTGKTSVRKQIGNAVPGCVAEAIFKECIKALEKTDKHVKDYKIEAIEID